MRLNYPIIDTHVHLRDRIPLYTKLAKLNGIHTVCYMPNCEPPLDNLGLIKHSLNKKRYCEAYPISAITIGLKGKKLVDIERIKPHVIGFSDDGNYLKDLFILREAFQQEATILAHCCPPYEESLKSPNLQLEYLSKYINIYDILNKGKLHILHISKKEEVNLIREAKKSGISITSETCPHYFTYVRESLDTKINPPLASKEDLIAIREGLADETIDIISSDFAPHPKPTNTGISSFESFIPLSYGLVLNGTLTEEQLKEKIYLNPKRIFNLK